jgi:hypothetical protein
MPVPNCGNDSSVVDAGQSLLHTRQRRADFEPQSKREQEEIYCTSEARQSDVGDKKVFR